MIFDVTSQSEVNMAQICVDNAQIRDGMGVQSVTLGVADSSAEEEEEAARLGEQGL